MAYDSATTAAVAAELRERLPGGRVDKIIQPSTFAVALLIRAGGANHWLMLSAHPQHARVALSAARLAGAFDEPSPFVMLLRKHLDGARLATVEQVGRDRVLRLAFRAHATCATLIAEVMGRHSNVILVDDKDIILGSVKRITPALSRQRIVLPHHLYTPPPAQTQLPPRASEPRLDPLTPTPDALARALARWSAMSTKAPAPGAGRGESWRGGVGPGEDNLGGRERVGRVLASVLVGFRDRWWNGGA